MTEEYKDEMQGLSSWIKNNLRIIISIVIVVLVAGAIYSYSRRSEEQLVSADDKQAMTEEEMLKEILGENSNNTDQNTTEDATKETVSENQDSQQEDEVNVAPATEAEQPATSEENEQAEPATEVATETAPETQEEVKETAPAKEEVKESETDNKAVDAQKEIAATTSVSQETEGSFIEIAVAGEGMTHLARKALNDYLEKNSDSALTPEHKVYIEDYLRKKVGSQEKVHIGTSVEFSKSLIQEGIEKSKSLSDNQIKHLQKYSVRIQ